MKKETVGKERQHFGLRTLKCGTASILLSASFCVLGGAIVQADEPDIDSVTLQVDYPSSTDDKTESKEQIGDDKVTQDKSLEEVHGASSSSEQGASDKVEDYSDLAGTTSIFRAAPLATDDEVKAGFIRLHFNKLPSDNLASLGLWIWDDVEKPSSQNGSWPTGAMNFSEAKADHYGYYLDVPLSAAKREKISFLINNTSGQNLTGDKMVELLSPKMNEVWLDEEYNIYFYEPIAEGMIRINYLRSDNNYDRKSLWLWGDVDVPTMDWPDGVDFEKQSKYGAYVDVHLKDIATTIGFLLLDESKAGDDVKIQPNDYNFTDLKKHRQIFLRDADPTIYTNPYFINDVRMTGAQQISLTEIETTFTTLENVRKEDILKNLQVKTKDNQAVDIKDIVLDYEAKKVLIQGEFDGGQDSYIVRYGNEQFTTGMNWQLKDSLYQYDGELGARVTENGQKVAVTLWSPSADQVSLVIYDKKDQSKVIGRVAMTRGDKGVWNTNLSSTSGLGITDYRGYYYHYEIKRGEQSVLTLDPYAKSLAAWTSDLAETDPSYKVAKAAFVNPTEVGPKDLNYATISDFKDRKDAIIYEAHVRDFTSDKEIAGELKSQFGTFSAFVEKLDYLKELGVTHIQLLPVLSYYYVDELKNGERMDDYASGNSNYNWGYDPQNYFSLTGMYSSDPTNPSERIAEFKELVHEIHKRDMGVILDVVYNHTAKTDIFEDLEPNYYHFMDADGRPRTSYGGGRLGTTHHMSRRVLVDSIKYLTDEYKVDGFRFDLMGDHDAETIQIAYDEARKLNPNLVMLGEGWATYSGDENKPVQPADQSWMKFTNSASVFSDDIRNTLKSGYPNEGTPAFITNGKQDIEKVFRNIKAQPTNFEADDPGDVVQYIAAHDNLPLADIIAQSIKKDPANAENAKEIHRRLRLGNLMILTSQGTPFIHSGQEYGRTKQFRHPEYRTPVSDDKVPNKSHHLVNEDGSPFDYPYFIHDSYDSSDAVNHFDWSKATNSAAYPEHTKSRAYMQGLIALRKSTDAFKLASKEEVDKHVTLLTTVGKDGVEKEDLVLGYQTVASNGDVYLVFVNADTKERRFTVDQSLKAATVLADGKQAGTEAIQGPEGVQLGEKSLVLAPLTATVLRIAKEDAQTPPDEEKLVKGSVIIKYKDINDRILKDNALVHYNVAVGTAYDAEQSEHKLQTVVGYDGKTYTLVPAGHYKVGEVDTSSHLVSSAPTSGLVMGNTTLIVTYVYQEVTPSEPLPTPQTDAEKTTPTASRVTKLEGELGESDITGAVTDVGQGTVGLIPGTELPTSAGDYEVSVIVTYPDQSTDELVVPVTLIPKTDTQKVPLPSSPQNSGNLTDQRGSDKSSQQGVLYPTSRKNRNNLPKTGSQSLMAIFCLGLLFFILGVGFLRKSKKSEYKKR
ncbi:MULTISPECIES: pullulanase [unclassified Streptococcus]|uniref:pullulanase n=1 Tax=unclassified Streptococcus TaxID=2608887 RepID=UPI001071BD5A|nr:MULTISPECIES: pullulanase [unclassified Streptococcus]MBF0786465.1 pullulanase [Streptococcus sp. 19428wC2_LYSM12]MCQ9212419.1 pullulanase [Streptococcus sp. B01]MCQ9213757.1 pullulanase [Streptococcus sp. O1]TFV06630.1 pullulanase [Streptococcus sp. LYSM12]